MLDLEPIKTRLAAASPRPWRAMRDGNQYVDVELDPRSGKSMIHPKGRTTLVGASRVDGLQRPWNPWWVGDNASPETQETVRLRDEDADFVAAAPSDIAALVAEVELLRATQSVTVLASEAIRRGAEAIGYCTAQQGWDADYAHAHAEVVFLPATPNT